MTDVPLLPFVVGGLDVATDRVEGLIIDLVTCHGDEESGLTPEAKRKRSQRERDEEAGVGVISFRASAGEQVMLAESLEIRGSQGVAYTTTEYINTLIRRDNLLARQQAGMIENMICENCRKPLPRGCGGVWAGELSCAKQQLDRALAL